MKSVDVVIIGAGSAGLNARRAALAEGASVAIIDPGPLGTTCARVGCMPSKLLIAAAETAHTAEHGAKFGVHSDVRVDPVGVMERVRGMRDHFVYKTRKGIDKLGAPIAERARFVGPTTIEAGGEHYEAKAVVIATGSKPSVPEPWLAAGDRLLTNEQVFELEALPQSLLVVGAGAVGLELGQAMHRLGVRVKVLDVTGLMGGLQDEHMVAVAREGMNMDLHLRHTLHEVTPGDDGVRVRFTGEDGEEHDDTWQYVLVAAGRQPRVDGLDLAAAGLDPMPPVNENTGQVGDSAVFLAGDVSGSRMLLHEAAHEGGIAGGNAARYPQVQSFERKTPLAVVFTDPQMAMVGHRGAVTGAHDFAFQSRAKVLDRAQGRIEVSADEDGLLTGAIVIGPGAEHLGHLLAWAVQGGFTVDQALSMPFYHPVLEEGLQSALRSLSGALKKSRAA